MPENVVEYDPIFSTAIREIVEGDSTLFAVNGSAKTDLTEAAIDLTKEIVETTRQAGANTDINFITHTFHSVVNVLDIAYARGYTDSPDV